MPTKQTSAKGNKTKRSRPAHRPKGSKNIKRDEVEVHLSRCKKCGSTDREAYVDRPIRLDACGVEPVTNKPYSAVVWRRTRCNNCGQHRTDKSYEFIPDTKAHA